MTRNHAVLWLLAPLLAFAAGCSITPTPTTIQLLDPRPETGTARAGVPARWSLSVARPETDPTRDSNRVLVRTPEGQLQVHASARWVASAPDLFRTLLVRHLRDSGRLVQVDAARLDAQRILAIDLRRFEVADRHGALAIEITADARLYDGRSGRLIGRKPFDSRHPLATSRPAVINGGFEAALAELLPALGEWIVATGAAAAVDENEPRAAKEES